MRSTFRWTTALSGLGIVAASLFTAQWSFAKTPATKMGGTTASKPTIKTKATRTQMTGTVVSKQGSMLTIMPVRGGKTAMTVMVPLMVKVTMGKRTMPFAALMKGDKVCLYMTDGKVTRIEHLSMAKSGSSIMGAMKKK